MERSVIRDRLSRIALRSIRATAPVGFTTSPDSGSIVGKSPPRRRQDENDQSREESMRARKHPYHTGLLAPRATAFALALLAGLASPAAAQSRDKVFELKLSHWVPPNHPPQKALEDWGAAVEKASGGT